MDDLISRKAAIKLAIDLDYESRGILKESKCREIENRYNMIPSAQPEIIRCKNCVWWDRYNNKRGYCRAAKHSFMSSNWEIGIYRTYDEDFFCADAEPKEKEGGD